MASSSGTTPSRGTVTAVAGFNPEADANALRKAMKGLGTDEDALIKVLSKRTNSQRQEIKKKFKAMFGRSLKEDIESETSGNFKNLLVALVTDKAVYEAQWLNKAMKGLGTNEAVLIEILATRSNEDIYKIKAAYKKKYEKDLEKDIKGDTSGDFERLLVSLCQAARDETGTVDTAKAAADAKALHEAGEKRWGTDESTFNKILVSRSYPHLKATFAEYERIAKRDIVKSIKSEMSGDLEDGMVAVALSVINRPAFFAEKLHKSMKGLGTNDDDLVRLVVTRCEYDMVDIKQEFSRLYKKTLASYIKDDTSGDYEKLLIALVGN